MLNDATEAARQELRAAVRACSERGLRRSAKWAAEQLVGLPRAPAGGAQAMDASPNVSAADAAESDIVMLAKSYFDVNEFKRAAHALRGARGSCGRFLRWCAARPRPSRPANPRRTPAPPRRYSLFLAGEKRKEEELLEEGGSGSSGSAPVSSTRCRVGNEQLTQILAELAPEAEAGRLDGFGHYVHALVLREQQQPQRATEALVAAVSSSPCLWSAWSDLAALNPGEEAAA